MLRISPNSTDQETIQPGMDIPADIKKLRKHIEREAIYADINHFRTLIHVIGERLHYLELQNARNGHDTPFERTLEVANLHRDLLERRQRLDQLLTDLEMLKKKSLLSKL
jgi:hypothetical protein